MSGADRLIPFGIERVACDVQGFHFGVGDFDALFIGYKNGGSDYRPEGDPKRVKVQDFEDKALGKVVPYSVYDVAANTGFVSVGITADAAEFAVAAVRRWLDQMGRERYPRPRELTITADGGVSNGSRVRCGRSNCKNLHDFEDEAEADGAMSGKNPSINPPTD